MPKAFLRQWVHDNGQFLLVVNDDGSIKDYYIKDDTLIDEYEYKVLQTYGAERAAVLFRKKLHAPQKNDWSDPALTFFYLHHPDKKIEKFFEESFYWETDCFFVTQEEWENPQQHKSDILERLDPKNACNRDYPERIYREPWQGFSYTPSASASPNP